MIITHNNKQVFEKAINYLERKKINFDNLFDDLETKNLLINLLKNKIEDYNFRGSDKILHKIYKEIKLKYIINKEYNIPYLAGYNLKDTIYFDKNIKFLFTKKEYKLIILHEYIEQYLLRVDVNMGYELSHQIAQQIEYCFYTKKEDQALQIKIDILDKELTRGFLNKKKYKIPKDLSEVPFVNYETDYERFKLLIA